MFQWLKNIVTRSRQIDITAAKNAYQKEIERDFFDDGNDSSSGVPVTRNSVWSLAPFTRATNLISNTAGRVDFYLYETTDENGSREKAKDHKSYPLVTIRPNSIRQTHFCNFKQWVADCIWAGNGYQWIERDDAMRPKNLWLLDPECVTPIVIYQDGMAPTLLYDIDINGHKETLYDWEVLHLRGLGAERSGGLVGYSLLDLARESLGWGLAVQKYGNLWFKNNGSMGATVIELDGTLRDDKDIERFKKTLVQNHGDIDKSHKFMILQMGAKMNRHPPSNNEAQFLESFEQAAVVVSQLTGVAPHKLGAKVSNGYNSLESENLALRGDLYDPLFVQIEQECWHKLLTEKEKEEGNLYFEFNRSQLSLLGAAEQSTIEINEYNNGLRSWEETRMARNLPAKKDDSQEWRTPSGVTSNKDPKPEPVPVPPTPAPSTDKEAEPVEDNTAEDAAPIARAAVDRLLKRLQKAMPSNHAELASHAVVFREALPGVDVDQFFLGLGEELGAVLAEQREQVISGLTTEEVCKKLGL